MCGWIFVRRIGWILSRVAGCCRTLFADSYACSRPLIRKHLMALQRCPRRRWQQQQRQRRRPRRRKGAPLSARAAPSEVRNIAGTPSIDWQWQHSIILHAADMPAASLVRMHGRVESLWLGNILKQLAVTISSYKCRPEAAADIGVGCQCSSNRSWTTKLRPISAKFLLQKVTNMSQYPFS